MKRHGCSLRRRIRHVLRLRVEAPRARYRHDVAVIPRHHGGQELANEREVTQHIDLEDPASLRFALA